MLLALLSVKRTYHDLSQSFAFLAVIPPGLVIALAIGHFVNSFMPSRRLKLAGIFLVVVVSGFITIRLLPPQILSSLWENINYPFGEGRLEETIGELKKKGLIDWYVWPGIFFLPMAGGLFGTAFRCARSLPVNPWLTTLLFQIIVLGMIFSRVLSGAYASQDTFVSNAIYVATLLGLVLLAVGIYLRLKLRGDKSTGIGLDHDALFLVVYFLVMLISARSAIRFDFFLAPIELVFGSFAIVWFLQRQVGADGISRVVSSMVVVMFIWQLLTLGAGVSKWLMKLWIAGTVLLTLGVIAMHLRKMWKERLATRIFIRKAIIVWTVTLGLVLLTGPMQLTISLGYAKSSYDVATAVEPFVDPKLKPALTWLKTQTPQNSVIAASWEWGSSINLMANRTTIVDEEQFEPWVYMMCRHVFAGRTEREALAFLKAHGATHLLITAHDINRIRQISYTGSNQASDREIILPFFGAIVEQVKTDRDLVIYRYQPNERIDAEWEAPPEIGKNVKVPWQVVGIYLKVEDSEPLPVLTAATLELRYQDYIIRQPPEQLFFQGKPLKNQENGVPCILLISAEKKDPFNWSILYLSEVARNSLAIRLYLLDETSNFFTPVYPQPPATSDEYFARIWEINYPPDLAQVPNWIRRK